MQQAALGQLRLAIKIGVCSCSVCPYAIRVVDLPKNAITYGL